MMKKIISFLGCLLPFGASAAVTPGDYPINWTPIDGVVGGTVNDVVLTGVTVASTEKVLIQTGTGANRPVTALLIQKDSNGTVQGLNVSGDFFVGKAVTTIDDVDIGDLVVGANSSPDFSVLSQGNVTIDANLEIYDGHSLTIGTPYTSDNAINFSAGTVKAAGAFAAQNIGAFSVDGVVFAQDGIVIDADTISVGALDVDGGASDIVATNNITIGTGSVADDENIANGLGAGMMNIALGGYLLAGNLSNSGAGLTIGGLTSDGYAGNLTFNGVVKNDNENATMNLRAQTLTVSGGDATNSSLVNTGNFIAVITGATHFENGVTLSMTSDKRFYLNTGQLTFGAGISDDALLGLFANNLNDFDLIVNNGDVNAGAITNGVGAGANANANMLISAKSGVNAASVQNAATLYMNATDGDIKIGTTTSGVFLGGDITGESGGKTTILASDTLAAGDVLNKSGAGLMDLNANTVSVDSVVNNSDSLRITAPTSATGSIAVAQNVVNGTYGATTFRGDLELNARDISVAGRLVNYAGDTSVIASDTAGGAVSLGGVDIYSGTMFLNALAGGATVGSTLNVSGGTLNLGTSLVNVSVADTVNIAGNVTAVSQNSMTPLGNGNMNVWADKVDGFSLTAANTIRIAGDISSNDVGRKMTFIANDIFVDDILAKNQSNFVFGSGLAVQKLTASGDVTAQGDAVIELYMPVVNVGRLNESGGAFVLQNGTITAQNGITISNGVWFGDTSSVRGVRLANGANDVTLATSGSTADIKISGGVEIGTGKTLHLDSGQNVGMYNDVDVDGTLVVDADANVNFGGALDNDAAGSVTATAQGLLSLNGILNNAGDMTLNGARVQLATLNMNGGVLDITAPNVGMASAVLNAGQTNLFDTVNFVATGDIDVTGDILQGGTGTTLNLAASLLNFNANSLTVSGGIGAVAGATTYTIAQSADFGGDINVANGATVNMNAGAIYSDVVDNRGNMALRTSGTINVSQFDNSGMAVLAGAGILASDSFATTGNLYQQYTGTLAAGDVDIDSSDYYINSDFIDIDGNVDATNLTFGRGENGLRVDIAGDVSGGTSFIGLDYMNVGGNFTFDNDSRIKAAIDSNANYWSTVSWVDETQSVIVNQTPGGGALIEIDGGFVADAVDGDFSDNTPLQGGQFGIDLTTVVDPGAAIWLVHAGAGIQELAEEINRLNVNFCNADGSRCFRYSDTGDVAYLVVRDTNDDGESDSIYVVFDTRFKAPARVFKIQPVVGAVPGYTAGEFATAGALDNLITAQLNDTGFYGQTLLKAMVESFRGTYLETFATELYGRMDDFDTWGDGTALARFSRLYQPREIEMMLGAIVLNDHTNARSFGDYLFDEAIWNRNRRLNKLWADVEFGAFNQKFQDGERGSGDRFSAMGGVDWRSSETMIWGLSVRASRTNSSDTDDIDLSYRDAPNVRGRVDTDVTDTSFGGGVYFLKTLSQGARLYGNVFADVHMMDVTRRQNFIDDATGDAKSFTVATEFGLLHDLLNQYIVGNAFARVGYNFGFDFTQQVAGQDYMNIKSDGYLTVTPGYSLVAQKRIYPSAAFQIRPYASIGVEYDAFGASDVAEFKFAIADEYTPYDADINPFWANIGAGVELLGAGGLQFGLGYRYQYNNSLQMHNVKISGIYRF